MEDIKRFAELLDASKRAVFFGGAGVSTESGMKDYRSEDGLYQTVKAYGVSPEVILSHSFFEAHPDTFYDFYYTYFLQETAQPNAAHRVLAAWEAEGKLSAVITQNIDGLHQAAGSRHVVELHGTTKKHYCSRCGKEQTVDEIKVLQGKVPHCPACGGVIRPRVVLYEESLEENSIREAITQIAEADLLIVGGTSLAVYPAAGFLHYFQGDHMVLINREATPYDRKADLIFRDKIGEVLSQVQACRSK